MPEVGTPLGIAIGAFLFDPHGGWQNEIGGKRGDRRIGVGHHDEIVWVAVSAIGFVRAVGRRLKVVVDLYPVEIELTVLEHAILLDRVIAGLIVNDSVRYPP